MRSALRVAFFRIPARSAGGCTCLPCWTETCYEGELSPAPSPASWCLPEHERHSCVCSSRICDLRRNGQPWAQARMSYSCDDESPQLAFFDLTSFAGEMRHYSGCSMYTPCEGGSRKAACGRCFCDLIEIDACASKKQRRSVYGYLLHSASSTLPKEFVLWYRLCRDLGGMLWSPGVEILRNVLRTWPPVALLPILIPSILLLILISSTPGEDGRTSTSHSEADEGG